MTRGTLLFAAIMAALTGLPALAQTKDLIPTQDSGVARAVIIDRTEVRVLRVEIQPGATRRIHQHDDVRFHLFLPLTAGIELTAGSEKPVVASVGQAYFMMKGTPHGFRNTGTSVAMVLEVFVKPDAPSAGPLKLPGRETGLDALAWVMALAAGTNPNDHPFARAVAQQ
jgi:quercetin dioxygenase-like cupin family protein